MYIFNIKRTVIILSAVLVATLVSASFNGCEGQDFISKQCAEDGETIAPLLTEHQHSTTAVENPNQHKSSPASIKNTKNGIADKMEKVPQGYKPLKNQKTPPGNDKTTKVAIEKFPNVQTQVGSTSKSKEVPRKRTLASEVNSLKKQNEDYSSDSPKKFQQTSSGPSTKPRKQQQQDIKHETSAAYSAKLSAKPSSQSFTEKLHHTVTKSSRVSAAPAKVASKSTKPKSNENAEKERSAVQNRAARSLPATDVNKSSNSLNIQSSIKETNKDNPKERSVLREVNADQSAETQRNKVSLTQNAFASKVKQQNTETLQKDTPLDHSINFFLNNQKQVVSESSKAEKPLDTDISINVEQKKIAKPVLDVFSTKGSGTNSQKNFRGNIKSGIQNRIRRSVLEEEKSPFSEVATIAPTLTTTATISETSVVAEAEPTTKIAEHGFTILPEKCDFLTSCTTPEDEEPIKHTLLEEPGLTLAIEQKSENNLDKKGLHNNAETYKSSETAQPQNRITPSVDDEKLLPPQPQTTVINQKLTLETTQSSEISSTPTLDTAEPMMTVAPPKAESLVSDLHHEHHVSAEWKVSAETSEVETLQSPVAIRIDGRDRELEYGVNDERSRPPQRLPVPKLAFPDVPQGESFHIQDLGLSEGLFVFSYLSSFLSWIQPYDFPVELLRDALWKRVSVVDLITESLQVEAGFIACLTIGVLLALGVPCILLVHACCRMFGSSSNDTWNEQEGAQADNCAGNCRRVTLVFIMQLVLVLLVAGIVSMFVTNEQMSHAVEQTPTAVHTALNDVNTFLRNSHQQLRFVITKTLDQAVDAIVTDLDDIEELLGRPIQNEIATETGVDIALDALVDFSADARAISAKVEALLSNAASTRDLIVDSRERLADLRLQVDLFRRQCPSRFRSLCDTVDTAGLDVVLRIESLLTEQRLTRVRDLRNGNLTLVAQQARGEFQYIPMRVEKETKDSRIAIKRQLSRQKEVLYDSAWSLDVVSRDLTYRVEEARNTAMQIVRNIGEVEQWRWLTGLGAASSVLFLWLLLLSGITCGCCGVEGRAGSTLLASVVLMSIFSVGLWALALSALLVGGHGEVFICRPLYDEPGYSALTRLVDRPGVLFQRSSGGFFSNLLYGNGTLDVPLRDVLEECQADGPAYRAFRLHQVFDVDLLSDHRRWDSLHSELRRLRVDLSDMRLLTPELQGQLQEMLMATTVNLTNFRAQISRQVTGRDLGSFADQLTSVANQITDLSTLSRLENLASRTRRLLLSHIQPLEQRKEDLMYQLTALEVQMAPLQRQVNQSLSHLRTIQFFIDNKAANISAQKSEEYMARLVGYMDQFRGHVLNTTKSFVAPCRPIWNLYHAMRVLFCRHVMDPLNGFWFATVWCLVLFMVATPPCLKLVDHYRHLKMQHQHNSSLLNPSTERQLMHLKEKVSINRSPSETLMISDQGGNWSTPGAGEPSGW